MVRTPETCERTGSEQAGHAHGSVQAIEGRLGAAPAADNQGLRGQWYRDPPVQGCDDGGLTRRAEAGHPEGSSRVD